MNLSEEDIEQVIIKEVKAHLDEISLAKRLQNVGSMSVEVFTSVISAIAQELNSQAETVMDIYLELALNLKRSWHPKAWENFTKSEKEIFLKATYPKTPHDESLDMMIRSFTNPTIRKIIYRDILLAVEKAKDAKKETKAGEYLGPQEPGGEPLSPDWKEYLEEVIKEEITKHLKKNE